MTGKNILLVEDDAVKGMVFDAAIKGAGHNVTLVTDLQSAKAALAGQKFDAIVTDKEYPSTPADALPNPNAGLELAEHIRATNKTIPVLVNSSTFEKADIDRLAANAGTQAPALSNKAAMQIDDNTFAVDKSAAVATIQKFVDPQSFGTIAAQGAAQAGGLSGGGDTPDAPASGLRRPGLDRDTGGRGR